MGFELLLKMAKPFLKKLPVIKFQFSNPEQDGIWFGDKFFNMVELENMMRQAIDENA